MLTQNIGLIRLMLVAITFGLNGTMPVVAEHDLEWYDDQTGQLKIPVLQPLEDPVSPHDNWVWKPNAPSQPKRPWRFSGIGDFAAHVIEIVLWLLAGGVLVWLLVYVLDSLQNLESTGSQEERRDHDDDAITMQKLAELPFSTSPSHGNLLKAAEQLYSDGEYGKAMICLFGYQLLQLDRHQRIQLWKGKTNGQYLRELNGNVWLASLLAETIQTFESYFFGHHAVSREQFESCWSRMEEFHARLETPA